MDKIDKKICEILQEDGKASSANLAERLGVSTSTANERVRRLVVRGIIRGWQARLDPVAAGAGLCCFMLVDMDYEGEADAVEALRQHVEVMELHHVSGAHSYLVKLRVADTAALQAFLSKYVKPLKAVRRTETLVSIDALKESSAMPVREDAWYGEL